MGRKTGIKVGKEEIIKGELQGGRTNQMSISLVSALA